jgi:molybdopterin-guanine dinucleotide biosynthesis protein A
MKLSDNRPAGILLAGGKSTRMGGEKGEFMISGKPMMYFPFMVLKELCDEVLVSSGKPLDLPGKHTLVPDEIKGIGPMGGLYSCLKKSRAEINMVLPYDMPGVIPELMLYMLKQAENAEILLPGLRKDQPEPLCGIYRRSVLKSMDEMISVGDYALHRLLNRVASKIIVIERNSSFFNEHLFMNINRPEDLQQFLNHQ